MNNLFIELNWELGNYELAYGKYLTDHKIKINDQIILNGGSASEEGVRAFLDKRKPIWDK